MNEAELRAAAICGVCGKRVGEARLPLFYRVRIERWGIKRDAVERQSGLEMLVGSVAIARALSAGEDMAIPVMDPVTLTVCEACSMRSVMVAELAYHEAQSVPEGA